MTETSVSEEFRTFLKLCDKHKEDGVAIENTAHDLRDIGNLYYDIENFKIAELNNFIERRNTMNLGSVTPLRIALMKLKLNDENFRACIKTVKSFCVRRVLCGYQARSYNELFIGLIRKLSESGSTNALDTVVNYLAAGKAPANIWPDNTEVRRIVQTSPIYRKISNGRVQMILKAIEQSLRRDSSEVIEFAAKLHIEHVMPQSWYKNWQLDLGGQEKDEATIQRDQIVHTLGNLTLVTQKINLKLSNSEWMRKREVLRKHSVLLLNRRFMSDDLINWNEGTISKRGSWMFNKIKILWPHANDILQ